jgi:hypothetical protein
VATTQPSVSGAFQVGAMLTLDPGVWTDAQTLTRNWTRDGVDIPGATGLTYWLAAADDGALISAYVDGTNATGTTRALATGGQVVVAGAFDALISGTPLVGETLTLTAPAVYDAVQWTRDGTIITGATAATYTTVGGDNGKTVAAVVTVGGDMLSSNGIYIAVPAPVSVVAPVITGSFIVGEELALTEGMWANGPTLQAQWTRDGLDIAGETGLTYTPVAGDVDTLISAYVDGTNTGGTLRAQATGGDLVRWDPFQITEEVDVDGNVTASVSWEGTLDWLRIGGMFNGFAGLYTAYHDGTPLANDHTAGVAGRALTILKTLPSNVSILHPNGVPAVGETLTAGAILILYTDGQAEPAFTVKWQRDGVDIPGATGATYVLTTADVGYDVRPVFTITATGQPSVTEYGSAILLAWDGPVATAAELGGVTLDASGTEPAAIVAPVIGGVGVEKVIFGTA